jgi:hypothetical protein
MNGKGERDEMTANRASDRRAWSWYFGVQLAILVCALLLELLTNFEYRLAMMVGSVAGLVLALISYMLWRRAANGPAYRSFLITLGFCGLFMGILFALPWGVKEWG